MDTKVVDILEILRKMKFLRIEDASHIIYGIASAVNRNEEEETSASVHNLDDCADFLSEQARPLTMEELAEIADEDSGLDFE